ncbi:MAG: hypothetical protein ACJ72E_05845 [Marmoricola sp.]
MVPTPTAAPVALATEALHACLDGLLRAGVAELDGTAQAAVLESVVRAESRLAAFRLELLAAADRSGTAERAGAASTGQWAARIGRTDQAETQRQVALATGLGRLTTTRATLASGVLSPAHAAIIVKADQELPTDLGPTNGFASSVPSWRRPR